MDINMFNSFAKNHQSLLRPAFRMKIALQTAVMGVAFWEKLGARRIKFSNGKHISVENFIKFVSTVSCTFEPFHLVVGVRCR